MLAGELRVLAKEKRSGRIFTRKLFYYVTGLIVTPKRGNWVSINLFIVPVINLESHSSFDTLLIVVNKQMTDVQSNLEWSAATNCASRSFGRLHEIDKSV